MKLIDHLSNEQKKKLNNRLLFSKEKDHAIYDFLDIYKIDGDELIVHQFSDFGAKKYEIFFKDIPRFNKLFGAEMRGNLTLWVDNIFGIYLNVPSLNILSNYHHYIDSWISEVHNGRTKPIWGQCNDYLFECQRFSKNVTTVQTATKWFEKYISLAEEMMKKGISWSNTKEIQEEFDYSYEIKSKLWKLDEQINEWHAERNKLTMQLDSYRERIKENFKKEREMMKDF